MKVIPLSEGSFTIDKTKMFVPFNEEEDNLQERAKGSLLVEVQPFVLVTSKDILLLDTGLGYEKDGALQIHSNLKNAGIQPEDVTKVLLTHLHKDHAGGVSHANKNASKAELNFSNATYYVHQKEINFSFEQGFPSFITEELAPLVNSDQLHLLKEDKGVIDDYIFYELTGGHSPFHQAFWIKEEDEIIFFGGDEAPQLQQMKINYKTKYDHDADKANDLRQKWWQQGNEEGWTFLFYHDIKLPVYKK